MEWYRHLPEAVERANVVVVATLNVIQSKASLLKECYNLTVSPIEGTSRHSLRLSWHERGETKCMHFLW